MADKKKSQLEIERTLKKATEGIEQFDTLYSKFLTASVRNIKEKHEGELKREIKKLQKLRESLKNFINSGDVKETTQLTKATTEIETRMGKMRNLDKDRRTTEEDSDPKKDQERNDFKEWLSDSLKKLQKKTGKNTTEKEKHKGPYKSKKIEREKQKKLHELEIVNDRNQFHITNLNKLLQSLPRNNLHIHELNSIRAHFEDYLVNCEDFDHDHDENFYDNFDLEPHQSLSPTISRAASSTNPPITTNAKSKPKDIIQPQSSDSIVKKSKGSSMASGDGQLKTIPTSSSHERVNVATQPSTSSTPERNRDKNSLAPQNSTQKTRSVKVLSTASTGSGSSAYSVDKSKESRHQHENFSKLPSASQNSVHTSSSQNPISAESAVNVTSNEVSKKPISKQNSASNSTTGKCKSQEKHISDLTPTKLVKPTNQQPVAGEIDLKKNSNRPRVQSTTGAVSSESSERFSSSSPYSAQSQTNHLYTDEDVEILSILEKAWTNFSRFEHVEGHGKNTRLSLTPIEVPAHHYHQHSHDDSIASTEIFEKYSIETLFFIFYFFQGTQAQLIAGQTLKKRSWGFHTDFMLWFQRHEEPRVITDTYEQGAYKFFDIHTWSLMKKDDFVFEYRYLEGKDF